jgi:hypothetical protein
MDDKTIGLSSHIPLLSRIIDVSEGDIMEIGTSDFSTLFLHWMASVFKRNVYSYENDPVRYMKTLKSNSKYHKVFFVHDWDEIPEKSPTGKLWGVILVDHSPAERRIEEIKKFADKADYVVIHDTEPDRENEYHYSGIWPFYKYIYHFNKISPWTSVVSNSKKLDNI